MTTHRPLLRLLSSLIEYCNTRARNALAKIMRAMSSVALYTAIQCPIALHGTDLLHECASVHGTCCQQCLLHEAGVPGTLEPLLVVPEPERRGFGGSGGLKPWRARRLLRCNGGWSRISRRNGK